MTEKDEQLVAEEFRKVWTVPVQDYAPGNLQRNGEASLTLHPLAFPGKDPVLGFQVGITDVEGEYEAECDLYLNPYEANELHRLLTLFLVWSNKLLREKAEEIMPPVIEVPMSDNSL